MIVKNYVYISAVNELGNQSPVGLSEVQTDAVLRCVCFNSFTVNVTTIITNVYYQLTIS